MKKKTTLEMYYLPLHKVHVTDGNGRKIEIVVRSGKGIHVGGNCMGKEIFDGFENKNRSCRHG